MRHLTETFARFSAEVRAIEAFPDVHRYEADPLFTTVDAVLTELESASNAADYEIASKKLTHTVGLLRDVCAKEAARWHKWESTFDTLDKGIPDALERDKRQ